MFSPFARDHPGALVLHRAADLDLDDVMQLARFAHTAFPNVPLLGTDIMPDHTTRKVYVLGVNSLGGKST